jgi:hypothetical protein
MHQIQNAVFNGDVCDVAAPNLIGPRNCKISQQLNLNQKFFECFVHLISP